MNSTEYGVKLVKALAPVMAKTIADAIKPLHERILALESKQRQERDLTGYVWRKGEFHAEPAPLHSEESER